MTPTDLEQFQRVAREFRRIADEILQTRGVKDDRLLAIANSIDGEVSNVAEALQRTAGALRRR